MAKGKNNDGEWVDPLGLNSGSVLPQKMAEVPNQIRVTVCLGCSDQGQTGKFCVLCGHEIITTLKCQSCGGLTKDEDAHFCMDCGKPF